MYTDISIDEFREGFGGGVKSEYQFIDVREAEEYAAGHIPGAVNIPLSEFMARVDEINEEAPALLVCNSGVRSAQAAGYLISMGYDQVFNLEAGAKGWLKRGFPLESALD